MAETVCQCATFRNVAIPLHRNHPCDRVIENKHVLCRPCAMNWHDGPCDTYYREPIHHITKTCAKCGHDSASHPPRGDHEPPHTWEELPDRFAHLLGGIVSTETQEAPGGEWERIPPAEFRDEGLLYAVNEHVLWPLGLSIAVDLAKGDDYTVVLMRLAKPEVIVAGEFDIEKEPGKTHPAERFVVYAKTRIERMPEEDARLARERLAPIAPDVLG